MSKKKIADGSLAEFEKRAKSVLWRMGKRNNHPTYDDWIHKIETMLSKDDATTKDEVIVAVSRDTPELSNLLGQYDFSNILAIKVPDNVGSSVVICANKDQSYMEDLRWAKAAAGRFRRTKVAPITCPNDSAWYLYLQALSDPKDFLGKVGQMEAKGNPVNEVERDLTKYNKKSVKEIDDMLSLYEEEETDEG